MRRKKLFIGAVVVAIMLFGLGLYIVFTPHTATSPASDDENRQTNPAEEAVPEPSYPLIDVQPIIDTWIAKQSGSASIVVYDLQNNQIIGEHNKSEVYFAASLYKLYVAYEGYLAEQRGDYQFDEPYLGSLTRGECIDLMIRESDSPCAEKLWVELGKSELTEKLRSYGINNTSMNNITTTAEDANLQLIRLWQHSEISEGSKASMLKSMANQIYRDALAKSFAGVTFYDKVGFRDYDEYHDAGIVELPDGRAYVVSLLTDGVGSVAMADLGAQILTKLTSNDTSE